MRKAFSLIELLVVIAIITILAAIIFPVFATVRGKARQASCTSNLKQIGSAVQMYSQDYDGRFPYAIDPSDHDWPSTWSSHPAFRAQIPQLPYLQGALKTYTSAPELFHCAGDVGLTIADFTGLPMNGMPTSFEKYGTSYYYRTEVAADQLIESAVVTPDKINLIFDAAGHWHGTLVPRQQRYNVLFVDGHVKKHFARSDRRGVGDIDYEWKLKQVVVEVIVRVLRLCPKWKGRFFFSLRMTTFVASWR